MHIGFTGPRKLTNLQQGKVWQELTELVNTEHWHVGDATGLDEIVRAAANRYSKQLSVYEIEGYQRWQFSERSRRMIEAIAHMSDACLYAFPNKLCPDICKPSKNPHGGGSGTWLTIAYAYYHELKVEIKPLSDLTLPDWTTTKQLKLF